MPHPFPMCYAVSQSDYGATYVPAADAPLKFTGQGSLPILCAPSTVKGRSAVLSWPGLARGLCWTAERKAIQSFIFTALAPISRDYCRVVFTANKIKPYYIYDKTYISKEGSFHSPYRKASGNFALRNVGFLAHDPFCTATPMILLYNPLYI